MLKLQNLISIKATETWRIIKYPDGYKEFITYTRQAKLDKDIVSFPESFTDLDSINIQLTEMTSTLASFNSVGIVGVGEISLDRFIFRLHRPGNASQSPELFMIRVFGR